MALGAVDLSDVNVLLTGSTDGIGRAAAITLAKHGATVLIHGRSRKKADDVLTEIESTEGTGRAYFADFIDLSEVRELCSSIKAEFTRLDVVVNNAGAYFHDPQLSPIGIEATMTVNHLAPFLLTHLLVPIMPASGRIVTTASAAHGGASLDPQTLDSLQGYNGFSAYARSKLANILFTRELARRLADRTANCYHPGFIPASKLWRTAPWYVKLPIQFLRILPTSLTQLFVATPKDGAEVLTYLAVSSSVSETSGEYFIGYEPHPPSRAARDDTLATELWEQSEELVKLSSEHRLQSTRD